MPYYLHAGPIRVRYENGFLRYLSLGDTEIIRMVYFAIRDHNWLTAALTFANEVIEQTDHSFHIQYDWQTDDLGIQMMGQVSIQGDADGTITVDWSGKALNSFRKNRVGLCVLHPIEGVSGQPAVLIAPDGERTNGRFPTYISPHQPFLNIQSMRWKPASGDTWQLDFSGDVFETEDQRNWTDASFKTYSTPLSRPFPVTVQPGDAFQHRIVFSQSKQEIPAESVPAEKPMADNPTTKPRIGVGQRTDGPPLTDTEATLLKELNLSHLRADVFFSLSDWQTRLSDAIADAKKLTVPLELAVFFGNDSAGELRQLQQFLQAETIVVQSIILYNAATLTTSNELLQEFVPDLRASWPGVLIGGGTDDNFAELNRNPFDFSLVDFVAYSVNPQVHAFDDLTLLENISGQVETVISARHLSGGKPVHISPVTLRSRFTTRAGAATERLNQPADPRQTTDFGADWTRRSLQALTNAGVASVTYYQSHGPNGLMNGDVIYPLASVL
ncbi:hypothetical protein [Spirosoma linguale]|uniref:Uncharacterized protein n=1 Tax=Spirosoma linguale (strain ATCC 33905 / DSM 74 / LMG 10896 / Claus 1) TaxID=504472 RepID=D2QU12_SPILD|nr:hypothetical protein Slin_6335 [Spirosoma linguale DSM 74]